MYNAGIYKIRINNNFLVTVLSTITFKQIVMHSMTLIHKMMEHHKKDFMMIYLKVRLVMIFHQIRRTLKDITVNSLAVKERIVP